MIPSWWLICVAKVTMQALVSVAIATDNQIMTCTKCCSIRRMAKDCVAIFTANDRTFEWFYVVRVS